MDFETSPLGIVFVITPTDEGDDRRPIKPGRYEEGVWVNTDLSSEPDEVARFCAKSWSPDVIAAYREAFPPDPEPEPVVLTTISKDAIWRRATDAEAEQMEAALQAQPVRIRRIYEGATFISTADELYGVLEGALVALFGAERAAELLEPTG